MTTVILNRAAGGGGALHKWKKMERALSRHLADRQPAVLDNPDEARACIEEALREGETRFVAAGGDGTVNLVVDTILKWAPPEALRRICVGAVGLGSSNDFHKPVRQDHCLGDVPFRLDFDSPAAHDVCFVAACDGRLHYWIVNASIGLVAEANRLFNHPDRALRFLKDRSAGAGIAYAAARTLMAKRDIPMNITVDCGQAFAAPVSNLGIIKNPNFSGSLTYRSPYEPASGSFQVHLCEGMSRLQVLATLWRSSREGFQGLPHTRSWHARRLMVAAEEDFTVEFDGETLETRKASFAVLKEAIQLCS